jgi:CRISPR-associated protein Csx3
MTEIIYKTTETELYTLIEFQIQDGIIAPEYLAQLTPPTVNARKGVILSGRGPIWLYASLIHFYHPTVWIACYDPRIGAVVVQSHSPHVKLGEVIPLEC